MSSHTHDKRQGSEHLSLPWLLVATPQLSDPNFKQSVVLIVDHRADGAMGFVLNRPLSQNLSELLSIADLKIPPHLPAWYGGPVDGGTGLVLMPKAGGAQADRHVSTTPPSICVSASEQVLARLIRKAASDGAGGPRLRVVGSPDAPACPYLYPFRFLVGYAGWAAGQLEEELVVGAWLQMPARADLIFDTPWTELWEASMRSVGATPQNLFPSEHEFLN